MTRLWSQGSPLEVQADAQGTPLAFTWGGERHQVQAVLARWRVVDAWWDEQPLWREYFRVTTSAGLLAVLFHDLAARTWHLERVYD